jgi:predicted RNase H-like nuclease (RuvC/YqgF family)
MLTAARDEAEQVVKRAELKAEDEVQRRVKQHERDLAKRRHEFDRRERKVAQRESALERKFEFVTQREIELKQLEEEAECLTKRLRTDAEETERLKADAVRRCEEIAGLTVDQSKKNAA